MRVPQELARNGGGGGLTKTWNLHHNKTPGNLSTRSGSHPQSSKAGWGLEQSNGPWVPFKVCTEVGGGSVQVGVRGGVP